MTTIRAINLGKTGTPERQSSDTSSSSGSSHFTAPKRLRGRMEDFPRRQAETFFALFAT